MRREFALPDLGEGIAEGVVVGWLVAVDQRVDEDDPLVEVETDKATVEIPSPFRGRVVELVAPEGAATPVGGVLLVIEDDADAVTAPEPPPAPVTQRAAPPAAGPLALPGTRVLARGLGVDLAAVAATGPGGRVTDTDVRRAGSRGLYVEVHGGAGPALLLLHGLGATGAVWGPALAGLAEAWPGRIAVPDLPGHGRSPWSPPYSVGGMAAAVAAALAGLPGIAPDEPLTVVGHSLGSAVGFALATGWFGWEVRATVAVAPVLHRMQGGAPRTPAPRTHGSAADAAAAFLRGSGLAGKVAPDGPEARSGIRAVDGGYTLAADPRTASAAGTPGEALLAAVPGRVHLFGGGDDARATPGSLLDRDPAARIRPGSSHNPHVDDPAWLVAGLAELGLLGRTRDA